MSDAPDLHQLLRAIDAELRAHPRIAVTARALPPAGDREAVLRWARRLSGADLPAAWLPLCLDAPVELRWALAGVDAGGVEAGCIALWPLDDSEFMYRPPILPEGGALRIGWDLLLGRGQRDFTPYDASTRERVGVGLRAEGDAVELWFYEPDRRALPMDVDLAGYARALAASRGALGWQRLFCPIAPGDPAEPALRSTLAVVRALFGEDALASLAISPTSRDNLARSASWG